VTIDYGLKDNIALVTGGAGDIGRAIVERLSHSGARVHVWDLVPDASVGDVATKVDVTDRGQIAAALAALIARETRLDIVVNCVGYLGLLGEFEAHDAKDWLGIVQVNLIGTMQVTQAVVTLMRHQGHGRIVNMGSLAGKEGLAKLAAYSAASGGVVAFTKALGRELAHTSIRVNCVAPGPIESRMIRSLGAQAVDGMIADSPMKRLGRAEEVAHLVAWLCSEASRFNTGAVFDMSGGRARY